MPPAGFKHTEEAKQKMRAAQAGRRHSEEAIRKMAASKIGKKLSEETKQKMREGQRKRRAEGAMKSKLMTLTGCSEDQYLRAIARYNINKKRDTAGFTLEQEIARSMETDDGKIIMDETLKRRKLLIQVNGEVPLEEAPAEDPLPCDSELVDEAFMFQVRKSLVSLHAKIRINRNTAWVDELD
jgi:hypothetical protein